ncbi:hypothetical protein R5R35_008056 [Gryllus longicercus]|uniref:Major facilitator superfamily (MFS) profile domain-containing protein n=1 Tax=Gryllus longicercus TaxID=2509291 RepID=A0AAN9VR40_9ORTH
MAQEQKSPPPPPADEKPEAAKLMGGTHFETSRVPQYAATLVVDILHLIYGFGIAWSAIALPVLIDSGGSGDFGGNGTVNGTDNGTSVDSGDSSDQKLTITLEQGSWLAAVLYISAVPPMVIFSYICERFGRKMCGYLIGIPYVLSAVLMAFASSFAVIQVSRALLGIGSSGIFVLAPLYVAETVEDAIRGRLGAFVTLMRNVGILLTYLLGTFLTYKQFEYVSIIPPVLFVVSWYWMPESPMFLLRQNKVAEAEKALRWLRGGRADVLGELDKMQASLAAMKSEGARSATLRDLFATRGSRKAFFIGLLMSCNQQLCGFFGVVSYTFMIFGEASPVLKDWSNVIVGAMLVIGIAVSMMIYDKIRRKVLLLLSNFIMISTLLTLSVYFYLKHHGHDVSQFGWLPLTAMSGYVLGYSAGVAALPIVILTEIFSPKIRNIALTTNGMFTWFIIFLVTKTFPMMTEEIGFHGACWFYMAWCFLGVFVIIRILPETRNRSLESILNELEYGKKKLNKTSSQNVAAFDEFPTLTNNEKKENL